MAVNVLIVWIIILIVVYDVNIYTNCTDTQQYDMDWYKVMCNSNVSQSLYNNRHSIRTDFKTFMQLLRQKSHLCCPHTVANLPADKWVMVKPGQALKVPEGWGSQISNNRHMKVARPALFQNCCVVLCIVWFVSFYVLFLCKCVLLPPGDNPIAVNKYIVSYQGCQAYAPTAFIPQKIFLVLICVRVWVDPWDMVRPEGICKWNIPMTPSGIKPATFWVVAQCLNQLPHRVPQINEYLTIVLYPKVARDSASHILEFDQLEASVWFLSWGDIWQTRENVTKRKYSLNE